MELVLVRHAEPEWVRDGRTVDDPPLTERGHAQAQRLAAALAREHFDHVLVSPLRRARETVAPVAEALEVEPTVLDWLAEIRSPAWNGSPSEAVERIFAESRSRPPEQHWDGLPGGESFRDFHVRVVSGVDDLLATREAVRLSDHPPLWRLPRHDQRLLVIAHAGTNAVALGHLLGIPPVPWEWERFVSFHGSVSVLAPIEIGEGHTFSLHRFSDTGHLPDPLRTR